METINGDWLIIAKADCKNSPALEVVMSLIPQDGGMPKFATHLRRKDDPKGTFWGHYFHPQAPHYLTQLAEDFEKRTEE